jgi:hypothetical protein
MTATNADGINEINQADLDGFDYFAGFSDRV